MSNLEEPPAPASDPKNIPEDDDEESKKALISVQFSPEVPK
jgi:hypothetical protein